MKRLAMLLLTILLPLSLCAAEDVYPRETDTQSLRHSALGATPHDKILRTDLDTDGDPDLLERWWNGKRVRWFDENDDMTAQEVWGDMVSDALQVDSDGDGFYDGPGDYNVKWADRDGDNIPDIQVFNSNPRPGSEWVFGKSGAVYYVTIDPDNSGRLADIDWTDLSLSWTRRDGDGANWRPNYHGNAAFLKEHAPIWTVENPEFSWENPFLFHDFDNDGLSEMSIRIADNRTFLDSDKNRLRFKGIVDQGWISYDLDNDTGRDNELDYDMTISVLGGGKVDYKDDVHEYPDVRGPDWVLPYYRHSEWRQQTRFVYFRRENADVRLLQSSWAQAFFVFDEDDDCHRWERVELYYPGDPYLQKRRTGNAMIGNGQADSLGDRGEWDQDFSGKGKLYRAEWDGKLHLLGAERGAWTVDRDRAFWGAAHNNGISSPTFAEKVGEVVQYTDSDGDGFFDVITFDYDGDKIVDRTDNLIEIGVDPKQAVLDAAELRWDGLRQENSVAAKRFWAHAQRFYRTAFRFGFADETVKLLALASSVQEKQIDGYWLRETLVRRMRDALPESDHPALMKAYYTHDMDALTRLLSTHAAAAGK